MDLDNYIKNFMINIMPGEEIIRKYLDKKKWLSSNYKMSIPSNGKNQEVTEEKIKIKSFQIAKYPVTNQFYHTIMGKNEILNVRDINKPKINISWYETLIFCNELSKKYKLTEYYNIDDFSNISINLSSNGFRLPTEVEWQYACKAGNNSFQYNKINNIGWQKENSYGTLHDVGEKLPNKWGLYDMLGNIWEWTWDLYNQETYPSYRVFRGGSYAEESRVCGATTRRKSHPDFSIDDLGFRLVRSKIE